MGLFKVKSINPQNKDSHTVRVLCMYLDTKKILQTILHFPEMAVYWNKGIVIMCVDNTHWMTQVRGGHTFCSEVSPRSPPLPGRSLA